MIKVFLGYDRREPVLFSVLSHSIHQHATQPVSITPLLLPQLGETYHRERSSLQSTEFSFSRFLVPYLCDYEGWAVFMDNDMIVKDDLSKLWALRDDRYAVQVVKHDHQPIADTKFRGSIQTKYEKKNWSSVMLFNCARCKALTVDYVNNATGLQLHQFKWLESEQEIGELPHRWNHLVGYDKHDEDVSVIHYTEGGPYFPETEHCEYAQDWLLARDSMNAVGVTPPAL